MLIGEPVAQVEIDGVGPGLLDVAGVGTEGDFVVCVVEESPQR